MGAEIAAAAIGAVGSGIDTIAQIGQNKKGREHQEYMYDKQNAYNTPVMQMQRFKDAGLNPHLIYGQGNSGNSSGVPPLTTQEAPKSKFADIAQNYIANRTQQTQVDNMKKAMEVMDAEIQLKNATTVNQLANSANTEQQTEHAGELFETVASQAKANLGVTTQNLETGLIQQDKLNAEIDNLLVNKDLTKAQISNVKQNIEESKARISNLVQDNSLKKAQVEMENLKLNLLRQGININDPAWMRIMTQQLTGDKGTNNLQKVVDWFKEWWGNTNPDR